MKWLGFSKFLLNMTNKNGLPNSVIKLNNEDFKRLDSLLKKEYFNLLSKLHIKLI